MQTNPSMPVPDAGAAHDSGHLVFLSHSSKDAPIAQLVCHRLEEQGIRCWIAPRDITHGDWASSIMEGLSRSDVFVIVVGEHSVDSGECIKEVTEATRSCSYIIPFKVDQADLSPLMRYHLGPCHWLDASAPPLEQRVQDLAVRIRHLTDEDAVYVNQNRQQLCSQPVAPRGLFVGREEELRRIRELLPEETTLFLQGMGGIGKSEIAKGYARDYRAEYDTILFATYVTSLRDLIAGDDIRIENVSRAEEESLDAWYRRKMDALQRLMNPRTLLIIDNFDTDADPDLEEIAALPCHLIITTRNDHSDYPTLRVEAIRDFDAVRRIFSAAYSRPVKDTESVDALLRLVRCHTITVELMAKQMKASFLKPAQMLARMQSEGLQLQVKEKVRREGTKEQLSAFGFIRQLFGFSGLNDEERHLLACMTLAPVDGIPVQALGEILDLEDYDSVNHLIDDSWLMLEEEEDLLQLHPVVCDVVREELHPSQESCADYIRGLWRYTKDSWFFTQEEKSERYPILRRYLQLYPEPCADLADIYADFVNVPWICGDFEMAKAMGQRYFEYCVRSDGEASERTALAALYLAGCYLNAGEDASAEPWYRRSFALYEASKAPASAKMAQACFKVGRCVASRREFDEATRWFDRAQEIYDQVKTPENPYPDQITDLQVSRERMYLMQGRYEEAFALSRQSYDVLLQEHGEGNTSLAYALADLGVACGRMGRYAEAEDYLRRAVEINLARNGMASIITSKNREAYADVAMQQGDFGRAAELYTALELDMEKCFGDRNAHVLHVREKRMAAEQQDASRIRWEDETTIR